MKVEMPAFIRSRKCCGWALELGGRVRVGVRVRVRVRVKG